MKIFKSEFQKIILSDDKRIDITCEDSELCLEIHFKEDDSKKYNFAYFSWGRFSENKKFKNIFVKTLLNVINSFFQDDDRSVFYLDGIGTTISLLGFGKNYMEFGTPKDILILNKFLIENCIRIKYKKS